MYKYPSDLIDYLTEQELEGSEIFTTNSLDGTVWIIKHEGLDKWISYIEWFDGDPKWNLVNICSKSFDRLHRLIHECEEE